MYEIIGESSKNGKIRVNCIMDGVFVIATYFIDSKEITFEFTHKDIRTETESYCRTGSRVIPYLNMLIEENHGDIMLLALEYFAKLLPLLLNGFPICIKSAR